MEFILVLILFFVFFNSDSGSRKTSGSTDKSYKGYNSSLNKWKKHKDSFDPADTFHLEDGLDHEVDCDGYCEECDDYHDYV